MLQQPKLQTMYPVTAVLYESCLLTVRTACQLVRKRRQAKAFVRKLWMHDSLLLRHALLIPTRKLTRRVLVAVRSTAYICSHLLG